MQRQDSSAYEFIVEEEGARLDIFLKRHLPQFSRSFIQKLVKRGRVTVNGKILKTAYHVKRGDKVSIVVPSSPKLEIKPKSIPLDILWEDNGILVINKPSGMVVHPVAPYIRDDTLVNALLFHCNHLSQLGGILRQGIVHRLDKDTSGVMVAAKDDRTYLSLSMQFRKRLVKKLYLALVKGNPAEAEGRIETSIGRNPSDGRKMSRGGKSSREAITYYKVLRRWERWSLLELRPRTGRTHQIRLHLHSINCFLVGDKIYGGRMARDFPYRTERGMLHARVLGFFHPRRGDWMEFEAPLPEDMKRAIKYLEDIDVVKG